VIQSLSRRGISTQLCGWLLTGEWRSHPVRVVTAIAAIALGVALGFAIDLINQAAFNEFSAAVRSLSGQSDLQVRGPLSTLDENFYPRLSALSEVAAASPVLEIDAVIPHEKEVLKILGIDVFRAARFSPDLIGVAAPDRPFDTLADDAIFLSPAALEWLHVKQGDALHVKDGTREIVLRVAGALMRARPGQRLAVMDIGAAQWRFNRSGQLSWIDLKLTDGVDRDRFRQSLPNRMKAPLVVTESAQLEARTDNMSRAYRVNLNVLASVALFTGAFLVFSTQALSVIRRRSQFALMRVIGLTRRQLLRQILVEGALLGIVGATIGLAVGYGIASAALQFFGGDLGGGYFSGIRPSVQFNFWSALIFFSLGAGVAVIGSLVPAWDAANAPMAAALKAGAETPSLANAGKIWPGLTLLSLGALLTQAPPWYDLPIFGYAAVATILTGGIALMPRFSSILFKTLSTWLPLTKAGVVPMLTLNRLANSPQQASIALGGVLSSFSLMVAMAIMVSSFRVSVDDWLQNLLSADLYVRIVGGGDSALFSPDQQAAIRSIPGVARADFLRSTPLTLSATRPSVMLIARTVELDDPGATLPLTADVMDKGALHVLLDKSVDLKPIWVSEAMVDLYGYKTGMTVSMPVGIQPHSFLVAGVWRDYARQSGAIQIRLEDYRQLTGDLLVNDVSLKVVKNSTAVQVGTLLHALPFGESLTITEPGEIRALSLKIFDRSFAVTYLLELVAIVIGLFGIAATFSAQTLSRAKEFGMLRHLGVTRLQILLMLAAEGGLLTASGVLAGFAIGFCISLILVFIVNPQSFHWTMQLHVPWIGLAIVTTVMLIFAALTALVSGRLSVSRNAIQAVKEDW
jgi:putative ABC transport system permease protein